MVLVKGPYLTGASDTGVEVRFELEHAQAGDRAFVTVSRSDSEPKAAAKVFGGSRAATAGLPGEMRIVPIRGLEPATAYTYAVRLGGATQPPVATGRFVTAPRSGSSDVVTFLVYGDDRTDAAAHAAVVQAMAQVPSEFLVNTGDLVADGARASDWQSFFDVEGGLLRDRALFVAIGNHELYEDSAGANFARYFGFLSESGALRLYGTARLGAVRFFFLNTLHDWTHGEERDWLARELERADNEEGLRWRIAVTHHGPFSVGPHGPNLNFRDARIPELLAQHGVDLILSGHDHIYYRGASGRLNYVVSGGGGAPLYRVLGQDPTMRKSESTYHFIEATASNEAFRMVAHRADGSILERCGFKKGESWDCDPPSSTQPRSADAVTPRNGDSVPSQAVPSLRPAARGSCAASGVPAESCGDGWSAPLFWVFPAFFFVARRLRPHRGAHDEA